MQGEPLNILSDPLKRLKDQKLFKDIPDEDLKAALSRVEEIHVLKDETVFRKGERYHRGVYFILDGQITMSRPGTNLVVICEHEPVGLSSFLGKTMYTVDSVAQTDCDLLFIHEFCVYRLMELSSVFRYRLIKEIQNRLNKLDNASNTFLIQSSFRTVGSCMSSPVITIQTGRSVADAARMMRDHKIGCLVVMNRKQILKGLITFKHLISHFMAELEENIASTEIEKYMNTEPVIFPPEYPIMEALNELQAADASYGLVMNNGKPAGIISVDNISRILFENTSVYGAHIETMSTLDELRDAFANIYKVATILAISSRVSRELLSAISAIHYSIQRQVFQITSNQFKEKFDFSLSDHNYCYLMFGSGTRKEMDLVPQINNAVALDDNESDETVAMFTKFAELYKTNLAQIGYPIFSCDKRLKGLHYAMKSKDWMEEIDSWSNKDIDDRSACFSCIMDMSSFDGDDTLVWNIKNHLIKKIADKPSTLVRLVEMFPEVKVPVSHFGGFIVEKEGPYAGMFNLKTHALHYLTNMTRLLSVYAGIGDHGTVDRIKHLARKNIIPDEIANQALTAFDTIMETIVSEQLNQAQNNLPINNYLNPMSLSLFYQEKLKRALHFLTIYTSFGINFIKSL